MTSALAGLALLALAGGWVLLPLVPTLLELHRRTDAHPLPIAPDEDVHPFGLAEALASRVDAIRDDIRRCRAEGRGRSGDWGDGEGYRIVVEPAVAPSTEDAVLVLCGAARLPSGARFSQAVFATEALSGGDDVVLDVLFADGAVSLGRRTTVLGWAHARSELIVDEGGLLHGCVTSEATLRLGPGTRFSRLHARRVCFDGSESAGASFSPFLHLRSTSEAAVAAEGARTLVDGDLEIRASRVWLGDAIARGRVAVDPGSRVLGSIKSHGHMHVGAGTTVQGSLVSAGDLELGPGCSVLGPVIVEGAVRLHAGCRIGGERRPTTLVAAAITVAPGTIVFGSVRARGEGRVDA
jgi:cytoskeletal protein CcmA (bactofilin family)